jgi:hypothetical protein
VIFVDGVLAAMSIMVIYAIVQRVRSDLAQARNFNHVLIDPNWHETYAQERQWLCRLSDEEFLRRVRRRRTFFRAHAISGMALIVLFPVTMAAAAYLLHHL